MIKIDITFIDVASYCVSDSSGEFDDFYCDCEDEALEEAESWAAHHQSNGEETQILR